jgi:hypothetical protein
VTFLSLPFGMQLISRREERVEFRCEIGVAVEKRGDSEENFGGSDTDVFEVEMSVR